MFYHTLRMTNMEFSKPLFNYRETPTHQQRTGGFVSKHTKAPICVCVLYSEKKSITAHILWHSYLVTSGMKKTRF